MFDLLASTIVKGLCVICLCTIIKKNQTYMCGFSGSLIHILLHWYRENCWKLLQFGCLTRWWWFHILSSTISLQILCRLSFTGVPLIQKTVTCGPTGSPVPAFLRDTRATASWTSTDRCAPSSPSPPASARNNLQQLENKLWVLTSTDLP